LITATGICQISRYDMDRWGEYWRFTDRSFKRMLAEFVPENAVHIELFGNVASAKAFLDGISADELTREQLDFQDDDYQVLIAARVHKPIYRNDTAVCGPTVENRGERIGKVGRDRAASLPLILLYHRIADNPLDAQLLAVSPGNFEAHLKELSENYRILPLHELVEEVENGKVVADTLAITFDDGYLDNLTHAAPLLERYGLHATVFVSSGMIDTAAGFWGNVVEHIFLTGLPLPEILKISDHQGRSGLWPCTTPGERLHAHDEIRTLLRGEPPEVIEAFVKMLLKWSRTSLDPASICPFLSSQQLRKLAASPAIEVGAHGVSHASLGVLSLTRQRQEIRDSKQRLEAITKKPVRFFAYPYGTAADFTAETERIVQAEGFYAGISNIQGNLSIPANRYALPRRIVRNWSGETFSNWLKDEDKNRLETETILTRGQRLIQYQRRIALNRLSELPLP